MKNKIVLPSLFIGLVLAGCARTKTDTAKLSSNDPGYGTQPAAAADQTAADKAAIAPKDAAAQTAQVATATIPEPVVSKDATAATPTSASNPSMMAAAPTPAESTKPAPMIADSPPAALTADLTPTPTTSAPAVIASTGAEAAPAISDRITEWKLSATDLKSEFDTSGRIVRSKTIGAGEPTGPMDAVLVGEINDRLKADADTSALKLTVEANKGVVTLNGSAHSLDQIGRAIALALDTGGVTQTVSLIKLDAASQP